MRLGVASESVSTTQRPWESQAYQASDVLWPTHRVVAAMTARSVVRQVLLIHDKRILYAVDCSMASPFLRVRSSMNEPRAVRKRENRAAAERSRLPIRTVLMSSFIDCFYKLLSYAWLCIALPRPTAPSNLHVAFRIKIEYITNCCNEIMDIMNYFRVLLQHHYNEVRALLCALRDIAQIPISFKTTVCESRVTLSETMQTFSFSVCVALLSS